jgi:hypothetical protein
MRRDRYTVAFDEGALNAMAAVTASTNYREIPDFIRASVMVMTDLLDAYGRKLKIVMRDDATGREWQYSPHEPGRAVPICKSGETPAFDNVHRVSFGAPQPDRMILGAKALENASGDATVVSGDVVEVARKRRRSR